MGNLKPYEFRVYLKNGEYYTYPYEEYNWIVSRDKKLVLVTDSSAVTWLALDMDEFSRVEVIGI